MINESSEKKLGIISIIILILLGIMAIGFLTISAFWSDQIIEEEIPTLAESYTNISVEEAYDILNKSQNSDYNLTIIDCRGCACKWRDGHIPGAGHNPDYLDYVNWTNDILVFGENTAHSAEFCKGLVLQVYGKLYNLDGGFKAWEAAGYPFDKQE